MKYDIAFCAVGDTGKKGVLYTFLKFEILYSGIEVSVAHPKVTVAPPIFCHCPVEPGRAIWPTLRTTELVNTRRRVRNFFINLFICCVLTAV